MIRPGRFAILSMLGAVLVLLALSLPAAHESSPAGAPASSPAACGQGLDANVAPPLAAPEADACFAAAAPGDVTDQSRFGGRTCRCSCGMPCKTDLDCGGGVGSCRPGISCC